MKRLITTTEVVEIAFGGAPEMKSERVSQAVILAAEQKFIKPVVNGLWERLSGGKEAELLDKYIKPPLAYYVKLLMLPELSLSVGSLGVVNYRSDNFQPASEKQMAELKKQTRSSANALIKRAVEHIESNPNLYSDYNPKQNILNRCSIASQIVL